MPSFGAIAVHSTAAVLGADGKSYFRVSPYVGNLASLGILRSSAPFRLQVAERWIEWYFAHLTRESAPDGVPDEHFYLEDGSGETTCVKPGDPRFCHADDATDSAAATFFRLVWAYETAGGKKDLLTKPGRRAALEQLAAVVLKLQQPNGLMWAKASYHAEYLEDNCEVYSGLLALASIETKLYGDGAQQRRFDDAAARVKAGITSYLYDTGSNRWFVALHEDGNRTAADLNRWYPDMQAQAWPILWDLIPPEDPRAREAIAALNSIWNGKSRPGWSAEPAAINGGWINADVACAAQLCGDHYHVVEYLKAAKQIKYSGSGAQFAWPFTVADAGWLLTLLSR